MGRTKITITLKDSLIGILDRISLIQKKNRSRLIEEAIEAWQRYETKNKLIEGYKAMAKEDVKTAEDHLSIWPKSQ